jgi:hypothetical protein
LRFYEECQGKVIYKLLGFPSYELEGGAIASTFTSLVSEDMLKEAYRIKTTAHLFQKYQQKICVPRHLFVDAYYEGNEQIGAPIKQDEEHWHHWLAQIYRDEALVTQRDERGMPTSSSSQPSVMAGMLEALDIQPGQTILEIGTGTGYITKYDLCGCRLKHCARTRYCLSSWSFYNWCGYAHSLKEPL